MLEQICVNYAERVGFKVYRSLHKKSNIPMPSRFKNEQIFTFRGGISVRKGFVFLLSTFIFVALLVVAVSIYYIAAEPQRSVGYILSDRTKILRFDSLESLENKWREVRHIEELGYSLPPMEILLSQWYEALGAEFPDLESFLKHYGIDNLLLEFRFTSKFLFEHDKIFVRSEEFVSIVGSVALTPRWDERNQYFAENYVGKGIM